MFPTTDNPAKRLLQLLRKAQQRGSEPMTKTWAWVFGLEVLDVRTSYRVFGHLNDLLDAVETRIRLVPNINHKLFLRDVPVLRGIISPSSINENWQSVKAPLDHGVLTGLEFCADELSKTHDEDEVPEAELKAIKEEFAELIKTVASTDLTTGLKTILMELLTSAIRAIDHYSILGNDGLKKSIAYSLGLLSLYREHFVTAKENGFLKRTGKVLDRLCKAVEVASKIKSLGEGIAKVLQLGSGEPPSPS